MAIREGTMGNSHKAVHEVLHRTGSAQARDYQASGTPSPDDILKGVPHLQCPPRLKNHELTMSKVNIKRAVENIRANTTVYTPIVEVVVNAIQAIESNGGTDGKIAIRVRRAEQLQMDGNLTEVHSFEIQDNGIGFNDENRQAFDTLYTDLKISEGGKGFGRFTCLKYFENLHVESVYQDNDAFKQRKFSMGHGNDIIVNEQVSALEEQESRTVVHLSILKEAKSVDKKLSTIARNLVERLLPYFLAQGYVCPDIVYTGTIQYFQDHGANNP